MLGLLEIVHITILPGIKDTILLLQTLDIIGKSAFGYEFNALKDKNTEVVLAFHSILGGGRLK